MNAQFQYDLLAAWENGQDQGPCRRALGLLSAATGRDATSLESITFGERDRGLLTLRERLFGTRLHGLMHVPPAALRRSSSWPCSLCGRIVCRRRRLAVLRWNSALKASMCGFGYP